MNIFKRTRKYFMSGIAVFERDGNVANEVVNGVVELPKNLDTNNIKSMEKKVAEHLKSTNVAEGSEVKGVRLTCLTKIS